MLAAFDLGNTQVTVGVFDGPALRSCFRLASDLGRPSEEYGLLLSGLLAREGIPCEAIDGTAIASVVPPLTERFTELSERLFHQCAVVVGAGTRTGVHVATHNPREVGPDRIVNAAAAFDLYGGPLIVIDFGTATAFDVIGADGSYLGAAIAPGLALSAEALFRHASRLHRVDLQTPRNVVGKDSASALQSGVMLGHVAMVEGMVARIRSEMGHRSTVVATGDLAPAIAERTSVIEHVEPHLALLGLRLMHELNQR